MFTELNAISNLKGKLAKGLLLTSCYWDQEELLEGGGVVKLMSGI